MAARNSHRIPPPRATEDPPTSVPSIEEALERGYNFAIGALTREAWQQVSGTKGTFLWGSLVWQLSVLILGYLLVSLLIPSSPTPMTLSTLHTELARYGQESLYHLLASLLCLPFLAGLYRIAIRAVARQPFDFAMLFGCFGKTLPLFLIGLLMTVLIAFGLTLLILPGVYLAVSYRLAIPLLVERELSPWQALEASRKAIGQHWFKVFGLTLIPWAIIGVSILGLATALYLAVLATADGVPHPIGIGLGLLLGAGLTWSYPLLLLTKAALYRTVFGVQGSLASGTGA